MVSFGVYMVSLSRFSNLKFWNQTIQWKGQKFEQSKMLFRLFYRFQSYNDKKPRLNRRFREFFGQKSKSFSLHVSKNPPLCCNHFDGNITVTDWSATKKLLIFDQNSRSYQHCWCYTKSGTFKNFGLFKFLKFVFLANSTMTRKYTTVKLYFF